jgi:hypothetical protein
LESGESITLPYQVVKCASASGNGASELDINVNTSFVSNVRELWISARDNTTMITQNEDKFMGNFNSSSLEGKIIPQGKPCQYKSELDP